MGDLLRWQQLANRRFPSLPDDVSTILLFFLRIQLFSQFGRFIFMASRNFLPFSGMVVWYLVKWWHSWQISLCLVRIFRFQRAVLLLIVSCIPNVIIELFSVNSKIIYKKYTFRWHFQSRYLSKLAFVPSCIIFSLLAKFILLHTLDSVVFHYIISRAVQKSSASQESDADSLAFRVLHHL